MKHALQFDATANQYFARIQMGGMRRRVWFGPGKKRARRALREAERKIASGEIAYTTAETTACKTPAGKKDLLLSELAHRHLEWVEHNRSPSTYRLRKDYIKRFRKFMGACMVSEITMMKLMEYQTYAREKFGRGANGGNEHMANVKTMLRWGEEVELCDFPVRRFPKISRNPPTTKRIPEDVLRRFLNLLDEDFLDFVMFGLLTGLRPREIRELRPEHVRYLANGTVMVFIEHHKTSGSAREPLPRSVPLSADGAGIVQRQMLKHPKSELVFLNEAGTPYSKDVLKKKFERYSRRAKVDRLSPYALRHTFASSLAEAGLNQITLAQLMGHTTVRTTARYCSNSTEFHQSAVNKQAAILHRIREGAVTVAEDAITVLPPTAEPLVLPAATVAAV